MVHHVASDHSMEHLVPRVQERVEKSGGDTKHQCRKCEYGERPAGLVAQLQTYGYSSQSHPSYQRDLLAARKVGQEHGGRI